MKDTYNLSEFRSFTRARQIAVALLFALTLAGPSRLWGQCQQSLTNMSFDKGSIIALTVDSTGSATGTVTLNCPYSGYPQIVYLSDNSGGVLTGGGAAGCSLGSLTCTFGEAAVQVASERVSGTLFFSGKMGWDSDMGRVRRVDVGGMVYHGWNRANFHFRLFTTAGPEKGT